MADTKYHVRSYNVSYQMSKLHEMKMHYTKRDINSPKLSDMLAICFIPIGLPAVVNMSVHPKGFWDGVSLTDACKRLEELGAAVVGLNCMRGPESMLHLLPEVRKACKVGKTTMPFGHS